MGFCPPTKVLFPSLRVPAPPMYHRRGEVAIKKASAKPASQFQLFEEFAILFPQLFEEFAGRFQIFLKQVQLPWESHCSQSSQKTSVNLPFCWFQHNSFPTFKSFSNQSFLCICKHLLHVDQIHQKLNWNFNSFLKHFHNCIGENHPTLHSTPKNFINPQTSQSRQCASCKMWSNFRNSFCYKWQSFGAKGKQRSPQTSSLLD